METPERILVIRLTAIGDVVLTLPAVSVLRRKFPAAKISFLTTRENAELLRGFRDVAETITIDRKLLRGTNVFRSGGELLRLIRRLRAGRFSLAVDFQSNGESGWLTRLTGAPRRWGVAKKPSRRWAYTVALDALPLHPAETHCALLRHCGLDTGGARNEFFLPPEASAAAREFFAAQKLSPEKPTLFIQPFTSAAHKNWPLENYVAVARHWRAQGVQVILGGGPADRAVLEPARAEGFAVSAGVPLLVTGGLLQLSSLALGGDTGALHLAVAEGRRVLMLMHMAAPASPIPYQHPEWVIAAPRPEAIAEIRVEEVNAAVARMISAPADNASC
jgi:ADP-heptose:LPS heptosyltransferase